jgi:hypothetical protein
MLLTGHDFSFLNPELGDVLDEDLLEEAWEDLAGELVAEQEREQPGTKPWAWAHFGDGS